MKIAVIKERRQFEERVSCTPEIVKKFINLGFKVSVQSDAGISSSYFDNDYKSSGAKIVKSEKALLSDADLIFAIVRPDIKLLKLFKKGSILICQMEEYINSNEYFLMKPLEINIHGYFQQQHVTLPAILEECLKDYLMIFAKIYWAISLLNSPNG